mmetsp:Transcript_77435/g.250523  ORF Transcript_77435/g.250523 Transcript_77435/m.250523 type:complete len:218 (+) Transcript_77435:237-890(+)
MSAHWLAEVNGGSVWTRKRSTSWPSRLRPTEPTRSQRSYLRGSGGFPSWKRSATWSQSAGRSAALTRADTCLRAPCISTSVSTGTCTRPSLFAAPLALYHGSDPSKSGKPPAWGPLPPSLPRLAGVWTAGCSSSTRAARSTRSRCSASSDASDRAAVRVLRRGMLGLACQRLTSGSCVTGGPLGSTSPTPPWPRRRAASAAVRGRSIACDAATEAAS